MLDQPCAVGVETIYIVLPLVLNIDIFIKTCRRSKQIIPLTHSEIVPVTFIQQSGLWPRSSNFSQLHVYKLKLVIVVSFFYISIYIYIYIYI